MAEISFNGRGRPLSAARWLIVAALGATAALLLTELVRSAETVGGPSDPPVVARNLIAVAGQITRDSYGVYLIDPEKGTMSVYQYLATAKSLRLLASRNCIFDLELDDYNTQPPPRQIKELVEQQKHLSDSAAGAATATSMPGGS